ncbi:hypothetical protein [Kibdelosporangium persicum]|uniref:hypothetical protein n=1 Tax=Kibdelosporangium persicum TaxID=2698649 RepID=UPI0039EFC169
MANLLSGDDDPAVALSPDDVSHLVDEYLEQRGIEAPPVIEEQPVFGPEIVDLPEPPVQAPAAPTPPPAPTPPVIWAPPREKTEEVALAPVPADVPERADVDVEVAAAGVSADVKASPAGVAVAADLGVAEVKLAVGPAEGADEPSPLALTADVEAALGIGPVAERRGPAPVEAPMLLAGVEPVAEPAEVVAVEQPGPVLTDAPMALTVAADAQTAVAMVEPAPERVESPVVERPAPVGARKAPVVGVEPAPEVGPVVERPAPVGARKAPVVEVKPAPEVRPARAQRVEAPVIERPAPARKAVEAEPVGRTKRPAETKPEPVITFEGRDSKSIGEHVLAEEGPTGFMVLPANGRGGR